jgi:transposase InsO family protein
MVKVASSVDNALIESFWSTMQRELLDRHDWDSRVELASAIFEGWYNPNRRHSSLGTLPARVQTLHIAPAGAA